MSARDWYLLATPTFWMYAQLALAPLAIAGSLERLVRDPILSVRKTPIWWLGRLGAIVQIVAAMAGIQDSITHERGFPLFTFMLFATVMMQLSSIVGRRSWSRCEMAAMRYR